MTSTQILEYLAKKSSSGVEHVRAALEMIDAGLQAPFIGRVRRAATGGMSESIVRRVQRAREELEELDRRRSTILRMLEAQEGIDPQAVERVRTCMDRFELEDLFVPHRRPEPEVQLAIDRGLGRLADELVQAMPRPKDARKDSPEDADAKAPEAASATPESASAAEEAAVAADAPTADAPAEASAESTPAESTSEDASASASEPSESAADPVAATEQPREAEIRASAGAPLEVTAPSEPEPASAPVEAAAENVAPDEGASQGETSAETAASGESSGEPTSESAPVETPAETPADESAAQTAAPEGAAAESEAAKGPGSEAGAPTGKKPKKGKRSHAEADAAKAAHDKVELTPDLARLCAPFVNPDRGIHTESEALEGAMRILSDRLGRNARLRGTIRRLLRKHGTLRVRATVDESRLGRHRSLLKIRQPLRQVQGFRLLGIRQAQKERVVTTLIGLDAEQALPKVRAALGKHTKPEHESVLDVVARRALERRLLPSVEADVRLELKERADEEALRFLAQHLRQVLLTPGWGSRPVVGVDVNAKGDWNLASLDASGVLVAPCLRVETGERDAAALAAELTEAFKNLGPPDERGAYILGIGHSKTARASLNRLREALALTELDAFVFLVNDSGLASYANSELARNELSELSVPQRMAVSLGRRLQDPLSEILKVDPRHLGLGSEQGLVSKANLRRMFEDVKESAVALIGCEVNRASKVFLEHLPGLSSESVQKLLERRTHKPFENREELRSEGLLSEAEWTSAVSFLRIPDSSEPLDATSLHPEQYDLARRVIESTGGSVEDTLRRPGATRGLRRVDFDADEVTWRDLMREIQHPGRDARARLFRQRLVHPDADPITLTAGRTLEGTVSNVASFGAFIDIGMKQDGLVHISEISDRYVRDARELLSIGQSVKLRITDSSGQRLALSLKNVVDERRSEGGRGRGGGRPGGGRAGGGGRGRRTREETRPPSPVRAAQTRRDGLIPGSKPDNKRRGGGGGRRGGPGPGGGRGRGRDAQDEPFDKRDLERAAPKGPNNPFANFFKDTKKDESPPTESTGSES